MRWARLGAAVALALAVTTGSAEAGLRKLQWTGGEFTNDTGQDANDFHVAVKFLGLAPPFDGPSAWGSSGPFDVTAFTLETPDDIFQPVLYVGYGFTDDTKVVAPGSTITLGGFNFEWDSSRVVGVDAYWTFDGSPIGDIIHHAGRIITLEPPPPQPSPEPASLALLGVGLLGLGLLRRRARPQSTRALDEGSDLGHA